MQSKKWWIVGGIALCGFVSQASAVPILAVSNYLLQPNTPNQQITLTVTGADAVTGFNLRAVIGNGTAAGNEPTFSSTVFTGGTMWDAFASTTTGGPIAGFTQDAQASVVFNTTGNNVPATGNVVKLFIDTTGFTSGTFPLSLTGTEIGAPSSFIGTGGSEITTTVTNGSITITPEPSIAAALLALPLMLRRRRA